MENLTIQQINHLILAVSIAYDHDFAINNEKKEEAKKHGGKRRNELLGKLYKMKWDLKEQL
tara:strand:+ start:782 stop:964 length:183 start_codon:yes stop_codon:yes gene_type:complete